MARQLAGTRVQFLGSFQDVLPDVGYPEIAVAGRSNVGKSSCLNVLVGVRSAARTSKRPGRTQSLNLFQVEERYVLADLPGYGFARVSEEMQRAWKRNIERYLGTRESLCGVILLIDPRRAPGGLDQDLLKGLLAAEIPVLLVATKVDKLSRNERQKAFSQLSKAYGIERETIVAFSAKTREGRDELLTRIEEAIAPTEEPGA